VVGGLVSLALVGERGGGGHGGAEAVGGGGGGRRQRPQGRWGATTLPTGGGEKG